MHQKDIINTYTHKTEAWRAWENILIHIINKRLTAKIYKEILLNDKDKNSLEKWGKDMSNKCIRRKEIQINKYMCHLIYMFNLTNNQDNIILIVKYKIDIKSYLPKYGICKLKLALTHPVSHSQELHLESLTCVLKKLYVFADLD